MKLDVKSFWRDVISQNRAELPSYFNEKAVIRWNCSNEQFTVAEYIEANCEYPNEWGEEIERIVETGDTIVLAGRVFSTDKAASYHVVSFIKLENDLIIEMDEYWADDGEAPTWRKEMKIGRPIR